MAVKTCASPHWKCDPIAAFRPMIPLWEMFHMFPTSNKRQSSIIICPSCGERCSSPSFNARLLMNPSADHFHKHLSVLCLLLLWILKPSLCLCMRRPSLTARPESLSSIPVSASCFASMQLRSVLLLKAPSFKTPSVQNGGKKTRELSSFARVNWTAVWASLRWCHERKHTCSLDGAMSETCWGFVWAVLASVWLPLHTVVIPLNNANAAAS